MFWIKNELPDRNVCPLLARTCIEGACLWWVHIRGRHPQTGAEVDYPDCAVRWLPTLLIEASKETRQAAAAVESLRNENASAAGALVQAIGRAGEIAQPGAHRLIDQK